MKLRSDRRALLVGVALAGVYVVVALVSASGLNHIRPLYEGPCPPTACQPCVGNCPTPSYAPYTPPPPPTHSASAPPRTPPPSSGGPGPTPSRTNGGAPSPAGGPSSNASAPANGGPAPGTTPSPVSEGIPAAGGTAASSDGEIAVSVPAGALSGPTNFSFAALASGAPSPPAGRHPVTHLWDIKAKSDGKPLTVFRRPILLVFHYRTEVPSGVAYWDPETRAWINFDNPQVDLARHTITVQSPHLTLVAAFAADSLATVSGTVQLNLLPFITTAAILALTAAGVYYARARLAMAQVEESSASASWPPAPRVAAPSVAPPPPSAPPDTPPPLSAPPLPASASAPAAAAPPAPARRSKPATATGRKPRTSPAQAAQSGAAAKTGRKAAAAPSRPATTQSKPARAQRTPARTQSKPAVKPSSAPEKAPEAAAKPKRKSPGAAGSEGPRAPKRR